MTSKTKPTTVVRSAKTGRFTVSKPSGEASTYVVKKKAASAITRSKNKHRDALKRLANR